jgi:transposase-like protein
MELTTFFTEEFKRQVVADVLSQRMTTKEAKCRYGIKGHSTILKWIRKYGDTNLQSMESQKDKPVFDLTTQKLLETERRLKEAELRILLLDTLIDIAEDELKIDIRKKSGAKPSKQ